MAQVPQTSPAPQPNPTPPTPAPNAQQGFSRTTMPYVVVALLTAAAMAWYFFLFVPAKLEYFVGLRLRTLAVAGGQVKGKAETLARSLQIAVAAAETQTRIAVLAPADIQLGVTGPFGLALEADGVTGTVPWQRLMAQASAASARDFDDLILATDDGAVVWQREKNTPRVGNLRELLHAEAETRGWLSLSWSLPTTIPKVDPRDLPKTAVLRSVKLGASSRLVLAQAVTLARNGIKTSEDDKTKRDSTTLYVAGLVSREDLQRQAMRIPLTWVVLLSLPVLLLFLALPFIKLATLTPKERYSFTDVVLMVVFTIAAAGIGASIPFVAPPVDAAGHETLVRFSQNIERALENETAQVLSLATTVANSWQHMVLDRCTVSLRSDLKDDKRCGFWRALKASIATGSGAPQPVIPVGPGSLELDVIIWLNALGEQTAKWTTKAQLTGPTLHTSFEHFRDLTLERTWRLKDSAKIQTPFTIEPLRAPTTSELGVVFAMPLSGIQPEPTVLDDERFLVLNVRPQSLVDPVVPAGFGFAVLASDGRILFHSEEGLSLEENFFEEVSNANDVRLKAQSGHSHTWSGDYHGRPHRFRMQSISVFVNCPWRLVTFEELEPALAAVVGHQVGTARLALVNAGILTVLALILLIYFASTNRKIRDLMMFSSSRDARWLIALPVLAAMAAAGIGVTYLPGAQRWSDQLYRLFALLPLLAFASAVFARSGFTSTAAWTTRTARLLLGAELGLLVLLVGAAPVAGFARVAFRLQQVPATERTLEAAQQRSAARLARVRERVNGPNYSDETRTILTAENGFADPGSPNAHSYLTIVEGISMKEAEAHLPAESDARSGTQPDLRQDQVRFLLDWSPFFSRDVPGQVRARVEANGLRLDSPIAGHPAVVASDVVRTAGVPWGSLLVGLLILCGTVAAVYWARWRLVAARAVGILTFEEMVKAIHARGNQAILLIGPPRNQKDQLVAETVKTRTGSHAAVRIHLLDRELTKTGIAGEIENVARQAEKRVFDAEGRLWIHVSNLETQLVTKESRTLVLQLLEKLFDSSDGGPHRVVVVTSSVDPIAHFEEIFAEERKGIYDDFVPEVELSRSSLLLSRFRRCYSPITCQDGDPWWNYTPAKWADTLAWEVGGYLPLAEIGEELAHAWPVGSAVAYEDLERELRIKAFASYQLLWTSCTRSEKLVLIQVAQEGFVTRHSRDVLSALIAKGLIVQRPFPAIFNHSFRAFLRRIERRHVVQEWERMDGNGLWVVSGRLIASSLIAGGLFYLLTQDFAVQSLLPIISGTGLFGVPLVRTLMARLSGSGTSGANA